MGTQLEVAEAQPLNPGLCDLNHQALLSPLSLHLMTACEEDVAQDRRCLWSRKQAACLGTQS